MIQVSDLAAKEVKNRLEDAGREGWGLRVGVKSGGCSGLSYSLTFEKEPKEKDKIMEDQGVKLFVDPKSYLYVNGMTLEFSEQLIGGGFNFVNPNASQTCSCGQSFAT